MTTDSFLLLIRSPILTYFDMTTDDIHFSAAGFGTLPTEPTEPETEMTEEQYALSMEGQMVACASCGEIHQAFVINYVYTKGFYCFLCI